MALNLSFFILLKTWVNVKLKWEKIEDLFPLTQN